MNVWSANGLSALIDRFRCPVCTGELRCDGAPQLICVRCRGQIAIQDGIVDFVAGRFEATFDAGSYDESHGIDDHQSARQFDLIRQHAGDRWPDRLGSVVEIGCGTGYLSRVLAASSTVSDLVLTDISIAMLQRCRENLGRLGLLDRIPIAFATYSGAETGLANAAFDTCVGGSVLHHIPDVPTFLSDMLRLLKPDGRAFFLEPNFRYHRATAQIMCDILALSLMRRPALDTDRQFALNWVAELWQRLRHQGDVAFLSSLEDKHLFKGDVFEAMAGDIGFASTTAIPFGTDPSGRSAIEPALRQSGVGEDFLTEVLDLMPHYRTRYMDLLHKQDLAPSYLFWLEKGSNEAPLPTTTDPGQPPYSRSDNVLPRYHIVIKSRFVPGGVAVVVDGWYVSLAETAAIRIVLDGVAQQTPIWRPRIDVHNATNSEGLYPSWTSLCSGTHAQLFFVGVRPRGGSVAMVIEAVAPDRTAVPIGEARTLQIGETISLPH